MAKKAAVKSKAKGKAKQARPGKPARGPKSKVGKKAAPARAPKAPARKPPPPARKPAPTKPRVGKEAVLAHHATPAAAPKRPPNDAGHANALFVANAGLDKKAEDVLVLDVRGLTSYADYFVIMTADSDRQASAIADHLDQQMKEKGVTKVGSEGYETGRWILVDYGDVVAHVMNRESRELYDLEGLWADAPRIHVED